MESSQKSNEERSKKVLREKEERNTQEPNSEQEQEPAMKEQEKEQYHDTGDLETAEEVVERLRFLTHRYFSNDKKTLEAAKFIAEREALGEPLEVFLANRPKERLDKYPSFPLDICKEWASAFMPETHFLEGV